MAHVFTGMGGAGPAEHGSLHQVTSFLSVLDHLLSPSVDSPPLSGSCLLAWGVPLPSNTSLVNRLPRLLLAVALGALIGTQLSGILADPSPASSIGLLLGFIVSGQLQNLVHELGHAAAGTAYGLRLLVLVAGKLVYRPGAGLKLDLTRPLMAGVTGLMPTVGMTLPQILRATRALAAAGPLLGLLFSAVCWLGFLSLPNGGPRSFLWVTALTGVYLHLITLLPGVTRHGFVTNGGQLLLLWWGVATAEPRAAVLALTARLGTQRPRDWPTTWVDAVGQSLGEAGGDLSALQFTVNHALDSGDLERTETLLARARTLNVSLPEARRSSFWAEETYLLARQGHAEAARQHLAAWVPGPDLSPVTWLRVQAAVLLAEGQRDEAMKVIEAAREQLDSPGTVRVLEAGFLDDLERVAWQSL